MDHVEVNMDGNCGRTAVDGATSPREGAHGLDRFSRKEASLYLKQRWGLACTAYSLARHAVQGTGPQFFKAAALTVYTREALDEWAQTRVTGSGRKAADLRPLAECGQQGL